METLEQVAPAFVAMAHEIVWAAAATVDAKGRPRSRVLHPIWEWDGSALVGWIGTSQSPVKTAHLAKTPYLSLNYWAPSQDTCIADCRVEWILDDAGRTAIWNKFKEAPEPVGYDPGIIPTWTSPTCDAFAGLRLTPWHLRVFRGSTMATGNVEKPISWKSDDA